jgi:hypothetical protein
VELRLLTNINMKKLSKKPNPIKGIELAMATETKNLLFIIIGMSYSVHLIGGLFKFRVQAPDFKGKKTLFLR